jgi:hypothetical protein
MHRPALVRLALCVGTLLFVLVGVAACGGGEAAEKKPTPDSPIASEPGWLGYQYQTDPDDVFDIKVHLVRVDGSQDPPGGAVKALTLPQRRSEG